MIVNKLLKKILILKTRIQYAHYSRIVLGKDEKQILKIQKKFLARQLNEAKRNVPVYKQLLQHVKITKDNCTEVLKKLPLQNKSVIDNSYYATYVKNNWTKWRNTGGSTCNPFHFPAGGNISYFCKLNVELFYQMMLYKLMVNNTSPKIVSIDGSRVNKNDLDNNIYWVINEESIPYGKYSLSTLYLDSHTLHYYINHLNIVKPDVLRGYPSGIYHLASLIKTSQIKCKFKIKAIYLTSENIMPYQETLISEVFDCPVWGQYGHTETSIFAIKRPGNLHYECCPLYGYTEILKKDGSHTQVGETGEIVVTGFLNSALPFIRYKTGDLAVYGGIKNGAVVLKRLEGRSGDFIIDNKGGKHYLVGLIFGGHLNAFNYINSWQITQNEPGKLLIKIIKGDKYGYDTEEELRSFFSLSNFYIDIKYVAEIPKTISGKQLFLIQNLIS